MTEKEIHPSKSSDPKVLMRYFTEILGFSAEEAGPMVTNWARVEPQTDQEIRDGILWEREQGL